ncbi:MAG: hypothetical protein ACOX50_02985 [Patescibacteria group bacterium]|jgi:hypothetical protein
MKKEVILSIVIGFGIGLIATFGVYTAKRTLGDSSQILSPLASNPDITPVSSSQQTLNLTSPLDQSISNESKTQVSGSTTPFSWIVILGEKGEKITQADSKGNFEAEILLDSGENEIEIQSISDSGDTISKVITIVYTTAEI